jgi:hypothetical protein
LTLDQLSGTITSLFGFPNKTLERGPKIRYNFYYNISNLQGSCSPSRTEGYFQTKFSGENQGMDINKMLADLRAEREQIEEAIMTLERLARGRGRRRGRPPAWMSNIKRRGRPPGSKNRPKSESKASSKSAVA